MKSNYTTVQKLRLAIESKRYATHVRTHFRKRRLEIPCRCKCIYIYICFMCVACLFLSLFLSVCLSVCPSVYVFVVSMWFVPNFQRVCALFQFVQLACVPYSKQAKKKINNNNNNDKKKARGCMFVSFIYRKYMNCRLSFESLCDIGISYKTKYALD